MDDQYMLKLISILKEASSGNEEISGYEPHNHYSFGDDEVMQLEDLENKIKDGNPV